MWESQSKSFPARGASNGNGAYRARLLSAEEFRFFVERERVRTDRGGGRFAVVVLSPRESFAREWRRDSAEQSGWIAAILKRLRMTDDLGWLDAARLAILLPDTSESGAWNVADDVVAMHPASGTPPLCSVYVYPHAPQHGGDDERKAWRRTEVAHVSNERAANAHHALDGARETQPLELILAKPLPRWKRMLDLACAAGGLVALGPLLLGVALLVRLTSRGPALYCQRRDGLGGRPFTMYKFRTMFVGADAQQAALRAASQQDGPAFKMENDPRITPLGRFLRKSCIDELPQLWNVLRGEMSLVGPRPLPCDESANCLPWQRQRLLVTPGLTCIWQVSGGMSVPFVDWMRMDIRYLRDRSLRGDIALLWKTFLAVVGLRASR